jgi:hypothetical protein
MMRFSLFLSAAAQSCHAPLFPVLPCSNGLDFTPMEGEDVLAAVHEAPPLLRSVHVTHMCCLYCLCCSNGLDFFTVEGELDGLAAVHEVLSHYAASTAFKPDAYLCYFFLQQRAGLLPNGG